MTRFTFIHAADLHLGSPLAGLASRDAVLAARFGAASREAFVALVDHAIAADVALMVVSGDIYDGDWVDHSIGLFFAREVGRLDRAGITFAFVRGNHDAESVIRKSITLPASVVEFPSDRAAVHRLERLRVALHGRSFPDRSVPHDFVSSYGAPVPGWFNVGLLHTSCGGHPDHDTYAPCSVAELVVKGYDYWALGHVHDYAQLSLDPPIVYPGNLQGRNVKECGSKGAVEVDVVDGRVASVRRLIVDRARFAHLDVSVSAASDEAEILAMFADGLRPHVQEAEARPIALRVTLRGVTHLHDNLAGDLERMAAELQAAAHRLHEDVSLERLRVRTQRPPRGAGGTIGALDPAALLAELHGDPGLRAQAAAMIYELRAKLPGGMSVGDEGEIGDDLDQLLAEAEATVIARLTGRAI